MTPEIEATIRNEYEELRPEVIRTAAAKLSANGIRPLSSDLDYAYNAAWQALYVELAGGGTVLNRKGFLVTVTHRQALNEFRAWHPSRRADEAEVDLLPEEPDLDARIDARDQLRQFREGLQARLSDRERQAATLCYLHGLTRPEAARAMDVSPKRMEKIMDSASGRIQSLIGEIQAGEFCDGMSSTIRAYAIGMLDPEGERHQLAVEHLDHCSACRRQVLMLRGFGAMTPIPVVAALAGGVLGGGAAAVGGTGAGSGTTAGGSGAAGGGGGAGGAGSAGGGLGTVAAVGAGALAVAAIVAAVATGTIGGGSGESDDRPVESAGTTAGVTRAESGAASARRAARARARQRAARREARSKRARRERAAAARAAAAREAAAVAAPVEAPPAPPEPPVAVEPPPAQPQPEPQPAPEPEERGLETDAAAEFDLR